MSLKHDKMTKTPSRSKLLLGKEPLILEEATTTRSRSGVHSKQHGKNVEMAGKMLQRQILTNALKVVSGYSETGGGRSKTHLMRTSAGMNGGFIGTPHRKMIQDPESALSSRSPASTRQRPEFLTRPATTTNTSHKEVDDGLEPASREPGNAALKEWGYKSTGVGDTSICPTLCFATLKPVTFVSDYRGNADIRYTNEKSTVRSPCVEGIEVDPRRFLDSVQDANTDKSDTFKSLKRGKSLGALHSAAKNASFIVYTWITNTT